MSEKPTPELVAHPEAQELTARDFTEVGDMIVNTLAQEAKKGSPRTETFAELNELYVQEEGRPRLRRFAQVLLEAPNAVAMQAGLDRLAEKLEVDPQSPRLREARRVAVDRILTYNHALRGTVVENPGMFTQEQLETWLDFITSDDDFGQRVVRGIAAEVAVARSLCFAKNVEKIRFANKEEDMRGADVVVDTASRHYEIDVKTGRQVLSADMREDARYDEGMVVPKRNGFEIGIHPDDMGQNFRLRKEVADELREEFRIHAGV